MSDPDRGPSRDVESPVESSTADASSPSPPSGASSETAETKVSPTASEPEQPSPHGTDGLVVRYGQMGFTGQFRHNLDPAPKPGESVVVRTERGVELGEVVACVCENDCPRCISSDRLKEYLRANGPDYPFRRDGKVLRRANHQDIIDHRHLNSSAGDEQAFCREQIRQLGLGMKLVSVEHLLGGERIVFYFSAEGRVDFRELVRRLAGQYRTRIEMRQVGARDEARLVGDYERCGRRCCCQEFLKDLKPVSMRMAKTQKATLDPSKISGRCGRLMCCLRYEDTGYEEMRKKLPKRNTWVRVADRVGKVVETQILTQLVRLLLPDGTKLTVANEEISERNVDPPQAGGAPSGPPARRPAPTRGRPARPRPGDVEGEAPAGAGDADTPPKEGSDDQKPGEQGAKSRRRRSGKKSGSRGGGSRESNKSRRGRKKRRRKGKKKSE